MFDLALSILCSSLIFVLFKLFESYKIETLHAIITNYVVAFICGMVFYKGDVSFSGIPQREWFWGSFAMGLLFITVFNLMAAATQKAGVSITSVATKMSLAIPVLFGVLVYGEKIGPLNIIGIVLALVSVYFVSAREASIKIEKSSLILPLLVFLGSGVIDTSIKYMQEKHVGESEFPLFSAMVFGAAALTGICFLIIKSFREPISLNFRNLIAGVVLGIPNYFSVYFLLRALQNNALGSGSIFTINNVAVVVVCTLLGILVFRERIGPKNWVGIGLALFSIVLVALF